jgi:predicted metalloprotease
VVGGLGGLLAVILTLVFGRDFIGMSGGGGPIDISGGSASDPFSSGQATGPFETSPAEEHLVDFVSFVLDDTQKVWQQKLGGGYRDAKLVLYRAGTESGCGYGSAAIGPFYCPADGNVYIDLSFYDELDRRFGAPGDFAQAYVLAHEIGHHVQNLLGTEDKMRAQQARSGGDMKNALSVRFELQADCYAGVWAHDAGKRGVLETGDVEEGLRAATAIGDDRLQAQAGQRVRPETFTHGSSEERMRWFSTGLKTGSLDACDTFAALPGR